MIFVIRYDRTSNVSEWLGEFDDSLMEAAQEVRLDAEIRAKDENPSPEIVVLSAASKAELRKTHGKYFGEDAIRENIFRGVA